MPGKNPNLMRSLLASDDGRSVKSAVLAPAKSEPPAAPETFQGWANPAQSYRPPQIKDKRHRYRSRFQNCGNFMSISIEAKLDRLVELCDQGEIRPQPIEPGGSFKTEDWEVTEEFVTFQRGGFPLQAVNRKTGGGASSHRK
jgi:hypothetical protein